MSLNSDIAVVIPAFNEAATLPDVVDRARAFSDEILVVDDGSTDQTPQVVQDLPCRVVRNPENLGKGASLRKGFAAALEDGPEAVITLDADGQHPPELIPRLAEHFRETSDDLVVAARLEDRDVMPGIRRAGNNFADFWISLAANRRIRDSQSGFRLYSAPLLRGLPVEAVPGNRFDFEGRILIEASRAGFSVGEIPIPALYPDSTVSSHYRLFLDTFRIVGMVAVRILVQIFSILGLPGRKLRSSMSHKRWQG